MRTAVWLSSTSDAEKIYKIVCWVPRTGVQSKFFYQDTNEIPLANKCIVVRSFVRRKYDKGLMKTGKFSDNLRLTENGLVSGVDRVFKSSNYTFQNISDQLKASAHSFKHFTSRPNLKKNVFIYAPITSDECHAWFHLNAASLTERNTEQVNITKYLVHGRIRTPQDCTASRLQVDRLHHSVNSLDNVTSEGIKLNVIRVIMYIDTIYK